VQVHDFIRPELGEVAPYGDYDIAAYRGWDIVGVDADTAAFAVEKIRRWRYWFGRAGYTNVKRLVVTADCGGSKDMRVRLWKPELQCLANEIGVALQVTHRLVSEMERSSPCLFADIVQNSRGKSSVNHEVLVQLIAPIRTESGIELCYDIDRNLDTAGIEVTDEKLDVIYTSRDECHGPWYDTRSPSQQPRSSRYFAAAPKGSLLTTAANSKLEYAKAGPNRDASDSRERPPSHSASKYPASLKPALMPA
jgi:hypothetical protein